MSSSAAAASRKRTKREDIKEGTTFYVKWDMEDGSSKYFKAIATGENRGGKFKIRYTEDDGPTEWRRRSTIDDESKTFISKETYDNNISAYPPKEPSVGKEHQVVELPQVGTDTSQHRALSMVPLTPEEVLRDDGKPFANKESEVDMNRAGRSKEGWGRKRHQKKKSRKRRYKHTGGGNCKCCSCCKICSCCKSCSCCKKRKSRKKKRKSRRKLKKRIKRRKSRKGGLSKKVRGYKKLLNHSQGKYNEIVTQLKNNNKRLHFNVTHPSF